jgi:hypothetical protein
MAGGPDLERQIFSDAGQPEPGIGPDAVDGAVSRSIRALSNQPDDQPPATSREQPQPGPAIDGVDDRSSAGLLRALLDERERRQDSTRRLEEYQKREREEAAKAGKPDLSEALFTDTPGTLDKLRQEWVQPLQEQIAEMRLNMNFEMGAFKHGELMGEAWQAWVQQVEGGKDATSYFQVMNSASPADAMVDWYKRNRTWTETGGDLDAYKQRVIDEYLASQGMGGVANGDGRQRAPDGRFTARPQAPQPQANAAPTSLSRMGAGASRRDEDEDNDGSDAAIFAAARPKRRGDR